MLRGDYKGKFLGSGSDTWKYWAELRAGNITEQDWQEVEDGKLQAARLVNPPIQRTVAMVLGRSKVQSDAVKVVAREITKTVNAMALQGMWRPVAPAKR